MMARDHRIPNDGGRADDDSHAQDDEDALAALIDLLAGSDEVDLEQRTRAAEIASKIMGAPSGSVSRRPTPGTQGQI